MRTCEATVLSGSVYLRCVIFCNDAVGKRFPMARPVFPNAETAESEKRLTAALAEAVLLLALALEAKVASLLPDLFCPSFIMAAVVTVLRQSEVLFGESFLLCLLLVLLETVGEVETGSKGLHGSRTTVW